MKGARLPAPMNLIAFQTLGWRAGACLSRPTAGRARVLRAAPAITALFLCAALFAVSVQDWAAASALLNRLAAIHAIFGAGLTAGLLYAGLSVFSGVANGVLAVAELLPQLALGGAMMGVLPFAQASDPSAAAPAGSGGASVARPEMQIGVYMGKSLSPPSDVTLTSPDGTDMTLKDVKWKPESFKPSPYYGGRGVDWSARMPNLGMMVDFTHAKATAIRTQTVTHTGRHKGEDVPPAGPFDAIFRKLEFTHGLNYLTLNGVYRATGLHRRAVPYAGLGIGFMLPYVEAWRAGQDKKDIVHGAQLTGFAVQLFGGVEWRLFKNDRRSVFTEYKMAFTSNEVTLKDGGALATNIWVHQFNFGAYFTPWRAGDAAAR